MRVLALAFVLAAVLPLGCASTSNGTSARVEGSRAPTAAASRAARSADDDLPMPSKIVHDPSEVPEAVRAIEDLIDLQSAIIADEVVIEVSKNYQFEVSLTGDKVANVMEGRKGTDRLAFGPATAFVRNVKIRADDRIRLFIADFGTEPFIKISARGACSYIAVKNGRPEVRRAQGILINDDEITFIDERPAPTAAR